ncbi:MAG: DUF1015 domain-containing protein [Deltaproteobacteria bacterium]|nr:DUF1015 domain-containing protein [Deltaproteobacteria bacterium]
MPSKNAPSSALAHVGLGLPSLLLPRSDVSLQTWAVVACDQYTSQPEYWQRVEARVADKPSTLKVTLPEVYLDKPDTGARIAEINATMAAYLKDGVLAEEAPGFMLVERRTRPDRIRRGLVVALDLERYDFRPGATSLIRATEGTIVERLPPRMEIRRHAAIELPHIMVLIDDPHKTVIEPLFKTVGPPRYDFELMEGGGHLRGFSIHDVNAIEGIAERLAKLGTLDQMEDKYGTRERGVFLYAMGDGNHSLATAKGIWEETKAGRPADALGDHPARYALVELVNVHDAGLEFEPIHRVLFGVDPTAFLTMMDTHFLGLDPGYRRTAGGPEVIQRCLKPARGETLIAYADANGFSLLEFKKPPHTLAVGTLQPFLDGYLAAHKQASIDYVHGEAVVEDLGRKPGHIGFFLPPIPKHDLFKTVVIDGVLPRKAFSMGDAEEKRFYMEARKIVP